MRAVGYLVAAYLIVRAVLEPFIIDFADPSTYQNDWGGPSLAGVLLVHCGPGVIAAILVGVSLWPRRRRRP